jgi:hypothetical protein
MTGSQPPPLPPPQIAPPVLQPPLQAGPLSAVPSLWPYRLWCLAFALLYLAIGITEVLVAREVIEPNFGLIEGAVAKQDPNFRQQLIAEKRKDAVGVAVMCGVIALGFAAAMWVPRKPWGWTLGLLVLVATIFPFVITAAGAIPLLLVWCKPEMKSSFGRPA